MLWEKEEEEDKPHSVFQEGAFHILALMKPA
jgi:hypothetical protein